MRRGCYHIGVRHSTIATWHGPSKSSSESTCEIKCQIISIVTNKYYRYSLKTSSLLRTVDFDGEILKRGICEENFGYKYKEMLETEVSLYFVGQNRGFNSHFTIKQYLP